MQSHITLGELSKAIELYFISDDPIKAYDYIYDCILQPERLSPKDANDSVCDSLISTNK